MDVATRISGDTLYVKISGPVDTPAAEILRTELNKIASQKPQKVVMDLVSARSSCSSRASTEPRPVSRSRGFTRISSTYSRQ